MQISSRVIREVYFGRRQQIEHMVRANILMLFLRTKLSLLEKRVRDGVRPGAVWESKKKMPLHSGPRAWTRVVEFFGPPLTPEPFSWPVVLLAGTVLLAALLFGMDSWSQELARRYDRRDGDGALGKMTKSYVNGNVFPASTDAVAPSGADGHTIDLAHYSSLLRRNRHAASASTGNLAAMWRG
eukprot:TRINITY_DN22317_c0_g1_i3.p1 TRINITY_DN22317_c0_g1~~TRINITY_DN22317_c0_g1_i3.p1  ORF type:complete len:184 (+),score=20.44 TRINITY_DN22317_c0_g1_i3:366-917(+)